MEDGEEMVWTENLSGAEFLFLWRPPKFFIKPYFLLCCLGREKSNQGMVSDNVEY